MAELASDPRVDDDRALRAGLSDADSAVRYWAAVGVLARGSLKVTSERPALLTLLKDGSPEVRVIAAEALSASGQPDDQKIDLAALTELTGGSRQSVFTAVSAWNSLDALGPWAGDARKQALSQPAQLEDPPHPRYRDYVPRLRKGGP